MSSIRYHLSSAWYNFLSFLGWVWSGISRFLTSPQFHAALAWIWSGIVELTVSVWEGLRAGDRLLVSIRGRGVRIWYFIVPIAIWLVTSGTIYTLLMILLEAVLGILFVVIIVAVFVGLIGALISGGGGRGGRQRR